MVELPRLNGGRTEKRWQPISQLTWCGPSSRSTSFMAVKIGRSGQPVQNAGGGAGPFTAAAPRALGPRLAGEGAGHGGGGAGDELRRGAPGEFLKPPLH